MTSCGAMLLPSDLDILRPSSAIDEAVGQHLIERRPAARADADQQRAVEPAAVLVAALEVDVGRPAVIGSRNGQHRLVARARVEPHVEDVGLALEGGAAARRAGEASRHELLERPLVPGVGAVGVEHRRRLFDQRLRSASRCRTRCSPSPGSARPRRAGARCTSRGGWRSSPRCAPGPSSGSSACRRSPSGRAPRRSLRLHGDEPLRRGQEDHRLVAAPAVRVLSGDSPRGATAARARPGPPRPSDSPPRPAGRRTARPCRCSGRWRRAGRRSRGRT